MNEALRDLAVAAGAPEDLLNDFWFLIFCQRFADLLLSMAEEELQ